MTDRPAASDALVLFGLTGDLAHKMIFPALYAMVQRGVLTVPVVGVASRSWSVAQLRARVTDSVKQSGAAVEQEALSRAVDQVTIKPEAHAGSGDPAESGTDLRHQSGKVEDITIECRYSL